MKVLKLLPHINEPIGKVLSATPKSAAQSVFKTNPITTDLYESAASFVRGVFKKRPTAFTKEFIESLSPQTYKKCLASLSGAEQVHIDAQLISEYGELLREGLKNTLKGRKYQLIGIGRSPSMTMEYLKLRGENAVSIPISNLTKVTNVQKELIENPGVDKYLAYLKNFGFDINKLDKDTIYIFTDYAVTGKSLDVFSALMKAKLPQGTKSLYWNLQDIAQRGLVELTPMQRNAIISYEQNLFDRGITNGCSPMFRLPYSDMGNIQQIFEKAQKEPYPNRYEHWNKVKFLMSDIIKKKCC